MNFRTGTAAAVFGWLAINAAVEASPPPTSTWVWVELDVGSCDAETFKGRTYEYSAPDAIGSYTTAVVRGTVVSSGLQFHDASGNGASEMVERAKQALPATNSLLTVALDRWDSTLCERLVGRRSRFNYTYRCDTLPVRGPCLVPLPRVEPA